MLQFVHISDTHLCLREQPSPGIHKWSSVEAAHHLLAAIQGMPFRPDCVLHTGDVCDDGATVEEYTWVATLFAQLACPVYYLCGNHDNPALLRSAFGNTNPESKAHDFVFSLAEVDVICLDSYDSTVPHPQGSLTQQQLDWLEQQLQQSAAPSIIVALHHHVLPVGVAALDGARLVNGEELHECLRVHTPRVRAVLCGHIHQHTVVCKEGISYVSAPGAWFQYLGIPGTAGASIDPLPVIGMNIVTLHHEQIFVRPLYLSLR
jgi:Icc protein